MHCPSHEFTPVIHDTKGRNSSTYPDDCLQLGEELIVQPPETLPTSTSTSKHTVSETTRAYSLPTAL